MTKRNQAKNDEPDWVDPGHDRKTPYSDEELERFVTDFIGDMADVPAWSELVRDVGEKRARTILKKGCQVRDEKNLANWDPDGPANGHP